MRTKTRAKINKNIDHSEATVKIWVKDVLKEYNVYYLMPVQSGIGSTGVDFHCVVNYCGIPYAFFIETKKFGKELTERQFLFASARKRHQNAITFAIDGMTGVHKLRTWLENLKQVKEVIARKEGE